MEKERKKEPKDEIYDQFYDLTSVASMTELTGLTPALPVNEEELSDYEDIYGVPVPDGIDNDKKAKKESR